MRDKLQQPLKRAVRISPILNHRACIQGYPPTWLAQKVIFRATTSGLSPAARASSAWVHSVVGWWMDGCVWGEGGLVNWVGMCVC